MQDYGIGELDEKLAGRFTDNLLVSSYIYLNYHIIIIYFI